MFAHAVFVGDRKWDLEGASDILVTISEELNVIIPANDLNVAVYIDVPLDCILEVSCEREFVTDSQKPAFGVVIQLTSEVATNCVLNATQYTEDHVALAFDSAKDATTLRRLLMPTKIRTNEVPPQRHRRVTSVSGSILSDDELAAPGPVLSNSQALMRTASLAMDIIPHGHALSTIDVSQSNGLINQANTEIDVSQNNGLINQANTEIDVSQSNDLINQANTEIDVSQSNGMINQANTEIDVSQRNGLINQANTEIDVSQNNGLTEVEQASEGTDVSEPGLSHEKTQHQDIQARVPNNVSSNAQVRPSQALGHRRQELIPPQKVVSFIEQVESKEGPADQDGEHNDLYDASPRARNDQRRSPRIPARDNVPQRLDRSQESTAREASVKTGPRIKLSRQLRNADGVVEPRTVWRVGDDLATSTKNDASDVKISANNKKSKAPASTKVRTMTSCTFRDLFFPFQTGFRAARHVPAAETFSNPPSCLISRVFASKKNC